jgi:hypothetical protein
MNKATRSNTDVGRTYIIGEPAMSTKKIRAAHYIPTTDTRGQLKLLGCAACRKAAGFPHIKRHSRSDCE